MGSQASISRADPGNATETDLQTPPSVGLGMNIAQGKKLYFQAPYRASPKSLLHRPSNMEAFTHLWLTYLFTYKYMLSS